jgi:hypothetical protein
MLLLGATALWAEARALGPDDWAYRELDALAQAGLLRGHPKGPLRSWASEVTRYEAASLTLRAVEGVAKAYQEQGQALQRLAQAQAPPAEQGARPVRGEDLARVEKLIEEFRAELVTMGARVDDLASALKDVQQRLVKVEAERRQHQIDGYMQLRFRDDNAPEGRSEFLVRNARINLRGPVSQKVSYRIEMQFDSKETGRGPGSKAQLRSAYIDYRASPQSRLRMGQATIPWGYELEEPTQELWSGERAFFMDRLFPDQRDLGLQYNCQRSRDSVKLDLASFNGTGIDMTDNNDRQNLMGRVDFPLPHGSIALSAYAGTSGEGTRLTRQDRDGVSARYRWGETQFMAEFVTGNDRGSKVRGWYGQIGHPVARRTANLLFAKYDWFDENTGAPDDLFQRWSLGYWYNLDKATRLTLVQELREVGPNFSERSKWEGNATYLQLQVEF